MEMTLKFELLFFIFYFYFNSSFLFAWAASLSMMPLPLPRLIRVVVRATAGRDAPHARAKAIGSLRRRPKQARPESWRNYGHRARGVGEPRDHRAGEALARRAAPTRRPHGAHATRRAEAPRDNANPVPGNYGQVTRED